MSTGGIGVWDISPVFKGVGYAAAIMAFWLNIFYIVVLAWTLFYLWHSFSFELPWSTCNNWWNTEKCILPSELKRFNISSNHSTSVTEFWEYFFLILNFILI